MSVYRHSKTGKLYYDFQIAGRRFQGPTGCTSEREARRVEKQKRAEAEAAVRLEIQRGSGPMTWGVAAARYWEEVAQHLAGAGADNALWSLEWLTREIGEHTPMTEITNTTVARVVAKRRGERSQRSGEPVAPATVNRSVVEPLRKVWNRTRNVWDEPVAKIAWRMHMLKEPKERIREMSRDEEERLFENLREDYHPLIEFALLTGVRLGEVTQLRWADVDWGSRRIMLNGKGGKRAPIPMPPMVRDILWPLQGHHDEFVFTYVCRRPRGRRRRGERYPITRSGLQKAFRSTLPKARIADFRFHDTRHTTATRILRNTGNLKLVQRLLRHEAIETTMRYAHVMDDDILNAMEDTGRKSSLDRSDTDAASPELFPKPDLSEVLKALRGKGSGE
jgi:integrase